MLPSSGERCALSVDKIWHKFKKEKKREEERAEINAKSVKGNKVSADSGMR